MAALEFHPLADLFPLMSDDEVDALGEDMLEHGQLKRIVRYEGKILDGRNRYIACQRKGIEPRYVDHHGSDPVGLVISLNLKRRHLDDSQRSIVAGKLENLKHGQTKADMPIGISRPDAASMLNVSKRSVARASDVIDHGVPDLVDAVEHGKVKVSAAAEFAKQNPPLDQARLIAEHGSPAAAVKAVAADTAEKKRSVKAKADQAEKTAAAKLAVSKPKLANDACDEMPDVETPPGTSAAEQRRFNFIYRAAQAIDYGKQNAFEDAEAAEITKEILDAAREAASVWSDLTSALQRRAKGNIGGRTA